MRLSGFLKVFGALFAIAGVFFLLLGSSVPLGAVNRSPWDPVGPAGPILIGLGFLMVALIVEVRRRAERIGS